MKSVWISKLLCSVFLKNNPLRKIQTMCVEKSNLIKTTVSIFLIVCVVFFLRMAKISIFFSTFWSKRSRRHFVEDSIQSCNVQSSRREPTILLIFAHAAILAQTFWVKKRNPCKVQFIIQSLSLSRNTVFNRIFLIC